MQSVLTGFKQFIMRGNVVELAIAVVIGTAFTALVNGIVEGLLNPLVALVAGRRDLSDVWGFTVAGTQFRPGLALDALLTFLLTAAAVYFFIKLPLSKLATLRAEEAAAAAQAAPVLTQEVLVLQEIRDLLADRAAASTAGRASSNVTAASAAAGGTSTASSSGDTRASTDRQR